MPKPKLNLMDLTQNQIESRIQSANKRLYDLHQELARRDQLRKYGTDKPDLTEYAVSVSATFCLSVMATSTADAEDTVQNTDWLEWYWTAPGGAVRVDDHELAVETVYDDKETILPDWANAPVVGAA